jgi:hypothetical protein
VKIAGIPTNSITLMMEQNAGDFISVGFVRGDDCRDQE